MMMRSEFFQIFIFIDFFFRFTVSIICLGFIAFFISAISAQLLELAAYVMQDFGSQLDTLFSVTSHLITWAMFHFKLNSEWFGQLILLYLFISWSIFGFYMLERVFNKNKQHTRDGNGFGAFTDESDFGWVIEG